MQDNLKVEAVKFQTMRHIERVRNLLNVFALKLLDRGEVHDQSKLESPEAEGFAEVTDRLAGTTYGSPEYEEFRRQLKPLLDHHYANNRHHPEHFRDGVNDMNLVDLVEMLIDWKASSERHTDGNILKSIKVNADRFGLSPQLTRILENTAALFDEREY